MSPRSSSTQRVDEVVADAATSLVKWLALEQTERRELVRAFVLAMHHRLDAPDELTKRALDLHPSGEPAMRSAVERVLRLTDDEDFRPGGGFRPGICAVVHETRDVFDGLLPSAILGSLLWDSVVVVRSNRPLGVILPPVTEAAQEVMLPTGTVSWLGGDDEAVDALISNPCVATVLTNASPVVTARLRRLAGLFGKPVIHYADDPPWV